MGLFVAEYAFVPLDADLIEWPFKPGPISPEIKLVMNNAVFDEVISKVTPGRPSQLSFAVKGVGDDRFGENQTFTHAGIFMGETRRINPYEVEVTLFDRRRFLENLRVSASFNKTRGTSVVEGEKRNRFFAADYMSFSLQDSSGEAKFQKPSSALDEQGVPWTALQAIKWLVGEGAFQPDQFFGDAANQDRLHFTGTSVGAIYDNVVDNNRVLQNLIFRGEKFSTVLSTLCGLAEVAVYVNAADEIEFYSPYEPAFAAGEPLPGGYDGAGMLDNMDTNRVIPERVNVLFPKQHEILLRYSEVENSNSTINRSDSASIEFDVLENVLRVPDDIDSGFYGIIKAGTWAPVRFMMNLWEGTWRPELQLSFITLRQLGYSWAAATVAITLPNGEVDPQLAARLAAIQSSYRKIFRIPSTLMELIDSWRPERVGFADRATGQHVSSPVWQDYLVQVSSKVEMEPPGVGKFSYNVLQGADPVEGDSTSPATLKVLDRARGVFSIQFDRDPDNSFLDMFHSSVKDPPGFDIPRMNDEGVTDVTELTENFHASTIITVSLLTPNGPGNMLAVTHKVESSDFSGSTAGPFFGPVYESVERSIPARYEWVLGQTDMELTRGGFKINDSRLVNEDVIEAVAQAKIAQILPTFSPRPVGMFSSIGYNPDVDRLKGTKSAVTVRLSTTGGLQTETYFAPSPPVRDIYSSIPLAMRRIVYREIERS